MLGLLIWAVIFSNIESDRGLAREKGYAKAVSLSKAYAQQLERTIAEMEFITLDLQYELEIMNGKLSLESKYKRGLYPAKSHMYISIVGRDGVSFTSTFGGPPARVADRDYFRFHKTSPSTKLHVADNLQTGRRSGTEVISFSRRVNGPSGTFNGVIVASVRPNYLAAFNDENSLSRGDLISIRHDNGTLLVSEKGEGIKKVKQIHIKPPVFPRASGVMRMPAANYADNQARILAWHKHAEYPLTSYVGLSETGLYVDHLKYANSQHSIGYVASFLLLVVALSGMSYSFRRETRKREAEEVKNTFLLAVDTAREGFYMVRTLYDNEVITDFVVENCNERGAQLAGYSKKSLIGKRVSEMNAEGGNLHLVSTMLRAMDEGYYEDEIAHQEPGTSNEIWLYRKMVRANKGLAITIRDITESKLHELRLISIANQDALTQLPNRYWLRNSLPATIKESEMNGQRLAFLYSDLDGFKAVNDTLGHQAGDILLKEAAERLKSALRPNDDIVRVGGDEFVIILTNIRDADEVAQIAMRISHAFRHPFTIMERKCQVGTSIGISLYPADGDDAEELLQKADVAMYAAKAAGKGYYQFYDEKYYASIRARQEIEHDLQRAIENDQFVLHYQPRINTKTGAITGLEALVRWQHPVRGHILPSTFIPIAENNGSIPYLGQLVFKKACAQIAAWRSQGERVVPVSVNVSAGQFNLGGVVEFVDSVLREHNLPSSLVEVEVTESAMTSDTADALAQVTALRKMGIRLHLDDFGTGYSSLARLQEFHFDSLKIDRTFISRLGSSEEADALVRTILLMANALKMQVIAEGIETRQQLEFLQLLKCDEVQGFLFAAPMPAEEIILLMRKGTLF